MTGLFVTPAKAGVQRLGKACLGARLRGHDSPER